MQQSEITTTIPTQIEINHLSDLHLHATKEKNERAINRLSCIADEVISKQCCPINIFTGDMVDDAKPEQMKHLCGALAMGDMLNSTLMVAGNHDIVPFGNQLGIVDDNIIKVIESFRIQQTYLITCTLRTLRAAGLTATVIYEDTDPFTKEWCFGIRKAIGITKRTYAILIKEFKLMIILLDSNPHHLSEIDFARGCIGPRQLGTLRGWLNGERYSDWRKVVCLHHHPIYHSAFLKLTDSDEFIQSVWDIADLVLFGHKHEYTLWSGKKSQKWNGYLSAASDIACTGYETLMFETFIITQDTITHTTNASRLKAT